MVALSETFFDEAIRKMPAAEARFRKKFDKARADLGTEVRLSLTHEDKEMPFVLAVCVEHRASPRPPAGRPLDAPSRSR